MTPARSTRLAVRLLAAAAMLGGPAVAQSTDYDKVRGASENAAPPKVVAPAAPVVPDGLDAAERLNADINTRNAEAAARDAAADAEYARRDREYEAKKKADAAAYTRALAAYEAQKAAVEAQRQAELAAWRAQVEACKAGDKTACAPK